VNGTVAALAASFLASRKHHLPSSACVLEAGPRPNWQNGKSLNYQEKNAGNRNVEVEEVETVETVESALD
jgi:hypothetical protein